MDHLQRQTRREYAARINRVQDYIADHLDDELRLETLAGVAGFSPWHFHRVFRGMTGETLATFIQRLRLQAAANRLINSPRDKISTVAYDCGFSSPSNFARAFKRHFGLSAGEFRRRKDRKIGAVYRKQRKGDGKGGEEAAPGMSHTGDAVDGVENDNPPSKPQSEEARMLDYKVMDFPRRTVAYVRVSQGYNSKYIGPAFQKVITWAQAHELMGPRTEVIGRSLDDPEVTPPDKCRYDACVTVPPGTKGEGEIGVTELPAGRYVTARVEGEYARVSEVLSAAWSEMFKEWFPTSGYKPGNTPCMEIYRETEEDYKQGRMVCDICEPVEPL